VRRLPARPAIGLGIAACMLWFFAPLVFQGQVLFERDVFSVWHAQVEAIVRAAGEGSLPLWDPHASFGEPVMEFAAQILYPPTWLSLLMSAGAFYSASVVSLRRPFRRSASTRSGCCGRRTASRAPHA